MSEPALHSLLVAVVLVSAIGTFVVLWFVAAPYGRHARAGWGPTLSSRAGWILMECPSVFLYVAVYLLGAHRGDAVPVILLIAWQVHYVHRTLIFPFRMRAEGKRMPLAIPLTGALFNCINSYVNARWISHLGSYPASWLADPRFALGLLVMLAGLVINLHSDTVLLNLRKPGETGYKIPQGGMYRWVSAPNYLGELLEWVGWTLATWSIAGLSFAVFTAANLVPRARTNHNWYREKFPDYPPERRALIPGIW